MVPNSSISFQEVPPGAIGWVELRCLPHSCQLCSVFPSPEGNKEQGWLLSTLKSITGNPRCYWVEFWLSPDLKASPCYISLLLKQKRKKKYLLLVFSGILLLSVAFVLKSWFVWTSRDLQVLLRMGFSQLGVWFVMFYSSTTCEMSSSCSEVTVMHLSLNDSKT